MKTRNGFVSNSSSSSFIIPISPIELGDVEDLRRKMYGDHQTIPYMYNHDGYRQYLVTYQIAKMLFDDIERSESKDIQTVIKSYEREGYDYYDDEIYELKSLAKRNGVNSVVEVSYSDNDGILSTELEHSGIIEETFPGTVRINQH
jgi:hypothetical protein